MTDINLEGLSDKQLRLFAVRCARRVQHLMTDPRSIAALDVAERHANGQATDEELKVAREAAYVAWDAALNVELVPIRAANFATRAATSAVALVTASDAAWFTASDAASAAGSVAAGEIDENSSCVTLQRWYAARDAERAEQQKILDEIRQEQM
jgi:hypothetical protein